LFINYGDTEAFYAMKAIKELRNAGVKSNIPMLQKWQNNSSMQIKEVFAIVVGEKRLLATFRSKFREWRTSFSRF
jgi:histidyl-tRNA synthetase